MARARKPRELKERDGTARKDRGPQKRHRIGGTTCPKWLSDKARLEWKRLGPRLTEAGVLRADSRMTFAAYCVAVGVMQDALERLEGAKDDTERSKAFTMADKAMKQMRAYGHQLGLGEIFESEGDTEEGQRKRKALSLLT